MRIATLATLCAAAAALAPARASALTAPHDESFMDGDCANCHSLTNQTPNGMPEYSAGCNACHANQASSTLVFPSAPLEARMGVKGTHHSWSGFAENPAAGASAPVVTTFASRLADGRIQCTVCHDTHTANPANSPSGPHSSIGVGVATRPLAGATGTATLTVANAGTAAAGYRIRLQSSTSFIITRTARRPAARGGAQWLTPSGSTWVDGTLSSPGKAFTPGTPVVIEGDLSVTFSTGGQAGDQYEFWVGYPGLRLTMRTNALCVFCHKKMAMNHTRAAGKDAKYAVDGVRVFSHPVGDALNANGLNTDRTAILDANGAAQSTGDGNATNDLVLEDGVVRCTTCHAVHGADSNSLTVDPR
jgi:hypothetical protein